MKRLSANVKGMEIHNPIRQCVVGKVSESKVVLRRYRPLWGNSFIPIFRGKFVSRSGKSILEGEYSILMFTKIGMSLWYVLVIGFGMMTAITSNNQLERKWSIIIAAVMLLLGIGLLHFGWITGKKDINYIDSVINESIK